jgi:hypothetical protein
MTAVLEPAGRARESVEVLLWCLFGFVYGGASKYMSSCMMRRL